MNEQYSETFKVEAYELLDELEVALVELEKSPQDANLIGQIFRAMHTIKGSASMFGFETISVFTHEIESVLSKVRDNEIHVTKHLIDLILRAKDVIKRLLDIHGTKNELPSSEMDSLERSFQEMIVDSSSEVAGPAKNNELPVPSETEINYTKPNNNIIEYKVVFIPDSDLLIRGSNIIALFKDLKELGEVEVTAVTDGIPILGDLDAEKCYVSWKINLKTDKGEDAIKDIFIFVQDSSILEIYYTPNAPNTLPVANNAEGQDRQHEIVPSDKKNKGNKLSTADPIITTATTSIRVQSDKLDALVNLVGELVTVHARLNQISSVRKDDNELLSIAEDLEHLTEELRDNTMSIRMIPIESIFSKFQRVVRDLANGLDREVEMITTGGETELDKTVIEKLNDPLIHIIRNSIDHGIESPDERKAKGKPKHGTICLTAEHVGASVQIVIEDDGKGLNTTAIREKALKQGLITTDSELSQKDLYNLIFLPGFSTAEKVTNVSGRGVGMDVVKQTINSLRGTIDIQSSPDKGTQINIRLPLTLSIIEGLLVAIGGQQFVIPLSIIEECMEINSAETNHINGRQIISMRGNFIPYIKLREWCMIEGQEPVIQQIIITKDHNRKIGLVVDQIIGQHQTVIKSLGKLFYDLNGISGATILGDGSIAFIIDVPQLIKETEELEESRHEEYEYSGEIQF